LLYAFSAVGLQARGAIMTYPARLLIPALLPLSGTAVAMPSTPSNSTLSVRAASAQPQLARSIFIRGGCTAGLDKVCKRIKGKLVCHCQS
jgi:hypothetical protein